MSNRQAPKSNKSVIWKNSHKDLDVYRGNMNLNNRRYSVSTANVDRNVKSKQVNVRPVKMSVKSASKSDHQLASSLGDIKKSTMIAKDSFISPKNQRNHTFLRSKDDSNEVGCPKKSETLNMKGGMVQRSNGIENSVPTPLKATTRLVPKETTMNTCSLSRKIGQSKLSQGDVIIGKRDSYEKLELAKSNHKKDVIMKVISPNLTSSSLDGNQFLQEPKSNLGNQYPRTFGMDLSNCQQGKAPCMVDNNGAILPYRAQSELCNRRPLGDNNGHTNNGKSKRWSGPLMEGKPRTNDDIDHIDGVVQLDNQTCRPLKKRRRLIVAIEDEDEDEQIEDRCCDQNHMGVEDDTTRSLPQTTIWKDDSQAKVQVPSYVQQHSYCCSKPIDEPVWSGIFKINGKEYMSLAGHLSTKSCMKACQFSKSLPPMIHMTKISRLEVWPKGWETSKTDDNNICLYFFPHKSRVDEELDQLVNELIDNDLALRASINEVEILIFTSTLLPQRYQKFQTKHYLWGVFIHKKDKGIVVEDALITTAACCPKVVEKEAQKASRKLDEVQWEELGEEMILSNNYMALEKKWCLNKSTQDVKATGVQGPQSTDFEPRATEEVRQGDTLCPTMHPAEANTTATGGSTISTSMMYGFVVPQTPRFEQLIREMEREGAVVWKGIQ